MSREMNEGELEIAMRELSPRTPQDAEAVARPDLPSDGFRWWAVVRDSDDKVVELLKDEAEANARAQGWMNHTGAGYSAFPVLAHIQRED